MLVNLLTLVFINLLTLNKLMLAGRYRACTPPPPLTLQLGGRVKNFRKVFAGGKGGSQKFLLLMGVILLGGGGGLT